MSMVLPQQAGLGTGLYFGGGGLPMALFAIINKQLGVITGNEGIISAVIAFLVALACLTISERIRY